MDKYLRKVVVSDFIVGDSTYFQVASSNKDFLPETVISDIQAQGGITNGGRIYGFTSNAEQWVEEEWFRKRYGKYNIQEYVEEMLNYSDRNEEGLLADTVQLYGMERYALDWLSVIEGDLSSLYDPNQNTIAAIYETDDYDKPEMDSNWAKLGDKVTLRYVDEWEYYDINTGQVIENPDMNSGYLSRRVAKSHEVTYTVTALVTMRNSMSYRYYGTDRFALNSEVYKRDTGSSDVMIYLFDTTKEANANMEQFLADYTNNIEPNIDYESKQSYADEFNSIRNMFLLLGGVLSSVIGLIGILNFLNAIITSILVRRQEFAMLQSIGMTGRQLKKMLVLEGLFYIVLVLVVSFIISLLSGPLLNKALSSMFWFFTYHFSLLPLALITPVLLILGMVLPFIAYRFVSRKTIVERLRVIE